MLSRLPFAKACEAANGTEAALLATFRVPALRGKHGGTDLSTRNLSDSDGDQTLTDSEFEFDYFTKIGTLSDLEEPAGTCFAGEQCEYLSASSASLAR